MSKNSEIKTVSTNKDLKAMYFVQKNGTEYLSDLMTRSFVAGYESNVDVILELVKQSLNLKDISEAVVWYNSYNKQLEIVPAKMNYQVLVTFLIQNKVSEKELSIPQDQTLVTQLNNQSPKASTNVSNSLFVKLVNFMKSIRQ